MSEVDQIIEEIDELQDILINCKAYFPALGNSLIGKKSYSAPGYYRNKGYKVLIQPPEPITKEYIKKNSSIGKWLNENAIIRLYGILHSYNHVGDGNKIIDELPGSKDVKYCCSIRHVITKAKLNYNPKKKDNIRLREELILYYNLNSDVFKEGIPTPIDQVVEKIFEGCRTYLKAKYKNT